MGSNIDCGCEEYLNLDYNWDAELPSGSDNKVSSMRKEEVEEVLVLEAPDPESKECKVELIYNWQRELRELLEGPDLLVISKWKSGQEPENDEYSFSTTGSWKKQCPVCLQRPSCTVGQHIICNHLSWFAYPRNTCWQCKVPVPQISRFK